jgi:hypothetical protein
MIDRSLLIIGWVVVAAVVFQMAPLTRLVYHPHSVEITDGEVVIYRSFPVDALGLSRPCLSYIETIRPISTTHNGGHPCVERGGPFQYSRADPVGTWSIAWASDCTDDPKGYQWSAQWFWHVGRVKLGPVEMSHTVLRPTSKD